MVEGNATVRVALKQRNKKTLFALREGCSSSWFCNAVSSAPVGWVKVTMGILFDAEASI